MKPLKNIRRGVRRVAGIARGMRVPLDGLPGVAGPIVIDGKGWRGLVENGR